MTKKKWYQVKQRNPNKAAFPKCKEVKGPPHLYKYIRLKWKPLMVKSSPQEEGLATLQKNACSSTVPTMHRYLQPCPSLPEPVTPQLTVRAEVRPKGSGLASHCYQTCR